MRKNMKRKLNSNLRSCGIKKRRIIRGIRIYIDTGIHHSMKDVNYE